MYNPATAEYRRRLSDIHPHPQKVQILRTWTPAQKHRLQRIFEPEEQIPVLLVLNPHVCLLKEGPGGIYFTVHIHNGCLMVKWGVSTCVPRRQLDYHACEVGRRIQLWFVAFENFKCCLIAGEPPVRPSIRPSVRPTPAHRTAPLPRPILRPASSVHPSSPDHPAFGPVPQPTPPSGTSPSVPPDSVPLRPSGLRPPPSLRTPSPSDPPRPVALTGTCYAIKLETTADQSGHVLLASTYKNLA
ncbi:hypothetical protein K438DRAFT_1995604 [Mycena galopus ATCC 62051]|nr:hypothetical protein K438DRAFT_1995604 [Mycena galopus ATCC 62051]